MITIEIQVPSALEQHMGFKVNYYPSAAKKPWWPWVTWAGIQPNGCDAWEQNFLGERFGRWLAVKDGTHYVDIEALPDPAQDHTVYRFNEVSLFYRRYEVIHSMEVNRRKDPNVFDFDMFGYMGTLDGLYGDGTFDDYRDDDCVMISYLALINEAAIANSNAFCDRVMRV